MVQPVQPVQLAAAQRRNGEGSCGKTLYYFAAFLRGLEAKGASWHLVSPAFIRKTFKQNASCSLRLKEDISNDLFFQKLQRQR